MTGSDTMTKRDKRSDGDYQRAVGDFVRREVIYCVSSCGLVGSAPWAFAGRDQRGDPCVLRSDDRNRKTLGP